MTSPAEAPPLLEARGLHKRFGGLRAVDGVDLAVRPDTVHGLIGPNGAGKTTLFNLFTGHLKPDRGYVLLGGEDITGRPPEAMAGLGLSRTFQATQLFAGLTIFENVRLGLHGRTCGGLLEAISPTIRARREEALVAERALEALAFVGLDAIRDARAGGLAHGLQRLVEIARALAAGPRLLLLDEPAAGLNVAESERLVELIRQVGARGTTVLLVEHDMEVVLAACDALTVLDRGRVIAGGPPAEVCEDPAVLEAYLGAWSTSGA